MTIARTRSWIRPVSLAVLAWTTTQACTAQDPVSEAARRQSAVTSPLALVERGQWQPLDSTGTWLVTPRFLPWGSHLLASGKLGRGLFLVKPDAGVVALDPTHRGPVEIAPDGLSLCLPGAPAPERTLRLDTGRREAGRCQAPVFDGELGQVLFASQAGRLLHHALRGELWWEDPQGHPTPVDRDAPWSIRVSPIGPLVVFSTGPMVSPTLHLFAPGGPARALGPGVHAVFHPDGRHLVYAVPSATARLDDMTVVTASELHAMDLSTFSSWPLTDTPDLAEMEPALSADGRLLSFADWRVGGLWLARFAGRR